jgi:hypothetical protein
VIRNRTLAAALAGALALAASPARADLAATTQAYQRLLAKYVTSRGVKYDTWRADGTDVKTLSEITMMFRSADPKAMTPDERKALEINLYNSTILELVLSGNPKRSITELSKAHRELEIFSRAALRFDGRAISLNDLEKRLRDEFKDPRVHFALNCASKSCPPIRKEPYVAGELDTQLDDAARKYLASPETLTITTEQGKTRIVAAKIFDWYADDFKATGGVLAFLAKYGPADAGETIAGGKVKLEFVEYDWGLNAAK